MALGALDIIIAADTAQLRKDMSTAVGIMQSSTQKMESFAKSAGAAIIGGLSLAALSSSIKGTIDLADSLGKLSQKVGVSVDTLYAFKSAGELADVSMETLQQSLLKFNRGIGDAELGTGDTANALKNLGISLKDSSGHLKTSDEYLYEVADKFAEMPDGIAKTTLAMQLFGKSGAQMIPLLDGGSESLREYAGVMNNETADAAQKFNDSLTRVDQAMGIVGSQMVTALSPTLSAIADDFENVAKEGRDTGHTLGNDLATGMKVAINLAYIVAGSFDMAGHALGNLAAAAAMIAKGDFDGSKFAWDQISKDAEADQKYWDGRIKSIMGATQESQKASEDEHKRNTVDLENFKAKEAEKAAAAKKSALEAKKLAGDIEKARLDAMRDTADREAEMFIGIYNAREQAVQDSYDREAQDALDRYNDELDLIERNANALAAAYDRAYELITPEIDKFNSQMLLDYQRLSEAGVLDHDTENKFFEAWQKKAESIVEVKDETIKLQTVFEDAFKSMEDSMVEMFMTGKLSAEDFFNTIIEGIIRMQIRNSITQPITTALGSMDIGSMISGFFASANGNAFAGGQPVPVHAFADGGAFTNSIVTKPTLAPMALFGEAGAEAIMPLSRDSNGKLGVNAQGVGKTNVVVNIENNSGTPVSQDNVSTSFDGGAMVVNIVLDAITRNKGGMRDAVRSVR